MWEIERTGQAFAIARANTLKDTVETLSPMIGLDPNDFKHWLTADKDPMPKKKGDRVCGDYKIPNVVVAYWGGDLGLVGRWWVDWSSNISALKKRGFYVDERSYKHWYYSRYVTIGHPEKGQRKLEWVRRDSGTRKYDLEYILESYSNNNSLHGLYFWGHGNDEGLAAKDGRWFNPLLEYSNLSLNYKLGLGVIYSCYSNSGRAYLSSGTPGHVWQGQTGILYPVLPWIYDIETRE